MTLPTQPFTLEGGLLGCVLLYLGFHSLAVALTFGLPLASGCGVGCQSLETSQNDLAGCCFVCRGETWGPEWGASLSGVGVGQWS